MPKRVSARIQDHFAPLTDPRRRKVTYPLINVVTIAICAVICGADDFVAIADYGRKKRKWLSQFLDLSSGIPSHDRFNAILDGNGVGSHYAAVCSAFVDLRGKDTNETRPHSSLGGGRHEGRQPQHAQPQSPSAKGNPAATETPWAWSCVRRFPFPIGCNADRRSAVCDLAFGHQPLRRDPGAPERNAP